MTLKICINFMILLERSQVNAKNNLIHIVCFILNSVLVNYMHELFQDVVKMLSDHKWQFLAPLKRKNGFMLCLPLYFYIVGWWLETISWWQISQVCCLSQNNLCYSPDFIFIRIQMLYLQMFKFKGFKRKREGILMVLWQCIRINEDNIVWSMLYPTFLLHSDNKERHKYIRYVQVNIGNDTLKF